MPKLLCPHCLQPLDGGYRGECPPLRALAGKPQPEGALPLGTQLGGRYTVGTYLSADGDGLAYRGVLNDEKEIRPHQGIFPGHTLQRPQRRRCADAQGGEERSCSRRAGWTSRTCTTT